MRGLIIVVLLIVGICVLGYYQGWFTVSKTENNQTFKVQLDKEKFKADEERAKEKAHSIADQIKEKAREGAGQIKDKAGEGTGKGHQEANPPKESNDGRK
jgi:hypothetical protein